MDIKYLDLKRLFLKNGSVPQHSLNFSLKASQPNSQKDNDLVPLLDTLPITDTLLFD